MKYSFITRIIKRLATYISLVREKPFGSLKGQSGIALQENEVFFYNPNKKSHISGTLFGWVLSDEEISQLYAGSLLLQPGSRGSNKNNDRNTY